MKKLFLVLLSAATLVACNKDAIEALEMSVDQLEAQVTGLEQARDAAQTALAQANSAIQILQNSSVTHSDLDAAVASLQQAITDGDVGAIRDAQDALDLAVANLQSVIDSLTAISFEYNSSNGVLTITMADGTVYETDDLRGEDGAPGAAGIQGPVGPPGATGASGSNGSDGAGGLSAYQIWLNSGNTGTEDDFLASLEGDDGDAGAVGELNGWTPDYDEDTANFDQTNTAVITIDGVEFEIGSLTRTIVVTSETTAASVTVETESEYLVNGTGYNDLADAQAAVEAWDTVAIGETIINIQTRTTTTTISELIEYTGTVSGTEDVIGTHSTGGEETIETGDFVADGGVPYTKVGDPADEFVYGEWEDSGDPDGGVETIIDGTVTIAFIYNGVSYLTEEAATLAAEVLLGDEVAYTITKRTTTARTKNVSAVTQAQIRTAEIQVNGEEDDPALSLDDAITSQTITVTDAQTGLAADSLIENETLNKTTPAAATWVETDGVYTHADYDGVSFTNVNLNVVIAFVAPDGVAQADLTIDGETTAVQTANGNGSLEDLIAIIGTLL